MRRFVRYLFCCLVFLFSCPAFCESGPKILTRQLFRSVLQIVQQHDFAKRRQMGIDLLNSHFDFDTFAQWTLQDHWDGLSAEKRRKFLELFKTKFYESVLQRLSRSTQKKFILKIIGEYKTKEYTELKCLVRQDGRQTRFSLFWVLLGHQWRLADVTIAKANLVANYQGQFNKVLRDSGFDELLKRLQATSTDRR